MVLPIAPPPAFDFRVESGRGLTVVAGGVPIVRGSYFQVVSPDWRRSYYGSIGGKQTVENVDADTIRVSFTGNDVAGTQTYHREEDTLKVRTEFRYSGSDAATVELAAGLVWVPALARVKVPAPPPSETIGGRRLGPDAPSFSLPGPLGRLEGTANAPVTVFDARRYPQSWAEGKDALWVGDLDLPLVPNSTTAFEIEWRIPSVAAPASPPLAKTLLSAPLTEARMPDESRPVLVPKPLTDHLNYGSPIEITGAWNLPIGQFDHFPELQAALARRFVLPAPTAKTKRVPIDGGVSKLGFNPGGYRITIEGTGTVSVVGEEDTGLRNAVERLAQIAFAKNGKLYLPTGWLYDGPKVRWRGVHLFGGPNARPFQKGLWTRVLRPLGFDHVVLQCERTAWDAAPGIGTSISMSKAQLGGLFDLYRNLGVEATPLVQSFGHMEWLFANGKNLGLAMNPDVPYAIDPRKPGSKQMMRAIWDEAIALARPKSVHFGLDEVAMRGWTGGDAFLTDTWRTQLAFLGDLARKHDVEPMLWGDQALFGKEAPDAALAGTAEDAKARRAAIPKGASITDWHYKADPRPETFLPVIQLWKDAGMRPIASAWYRPDNIRGFALAAGLLDAGFLQTTWAGYESSEKAMLENPRQFSAMVLAADYAWSGRKEKPEELPYDPQEVFRKLYFGRPSPLTPMPGIAFGGGEAFDIAGIRFHALDYRLASALKPADGGAGELNLAVSGKGRELHLALGSEVAASEGDFVAEVRVERAGAPPLVERLVYGRDIRALSDPEMLFKGVRAPGGPSDFRIDLGAGGSAVTRIVVRPLDAYSGVRLMGATLVR